jgi:hypothetical protein
MKRTLAVAALFVCLWPLSVRADTQSPEPGTFMPGSGRAILSPALQLPVALKPPVACSPETRGTIALNSRVHLCLCDGQSWKLVNTDSVCSWSSAVR